MGKQNENSTPVRIKQTRGYIPLFFMLSVVLLGLSVYCVVYAYTSKMTGIPATVFYVAGVIGIVFFAYSAFDNLFQTIQPKNALIIGDDGFADFTVGGVGVGNISWDNVKSVRTERSRDGRLLVIELNDMNSVYDNAPKSVQKAIDRADGLTTNSIAIRQIDVTERVTKIEEIFKAHIGVLKEREMHKNAEEDNSKTKVMNDEEVREFFRAINDRAGNRAVDKPLHDEDGHAAKKPKHLADDEDDDVLIAAQDMSPHDANAVPEKQDTASDTDSLPTDEKDEELPPPVPSEEAESSEADENPIGQKAGNELQSSAENDVAPEPVKEKVSEAKPSDAAGIDSLLESVIPASRKESNARNLDELLTKFNDDLKNGTSKLNDKERDELTNELTAMLENIKRKKNKK